MTRLLAALVLVLVVAASVGADPPVGELKYTPPAAPTAPDPTGLLLRLFGLTGGMLVLCWTSVWLARRVNRPRAATTTDGASRIRHQGSLALDRRATLHLFEVDGQPVAVTTDTSGLRSIVVLSEPFETTLAEAKPESPVTG